MNRDIFFIIFFVFFQHKLLISSYGKRWILQARSEMEADRKLSVFYLELLYVACSCCRYNAGSDWVNCRALFPRNAHGLITGLQKQSKKLYNKQLVNLERSVFTLGQYGKVSV